MFWKTPNPPAPSPMAVRLLQKSLAYQEMDRGLQLLRTVINANLGTFEAWQLLLLGALLAFLLQRVVVAVQRNWRTVVDKGLLQVITAVFLDLPGVRSAVARRQAEGIAKLRTELQKGKGVHDAITSLPSEGISASQIKARLSRKASDDVQFTQEGASRVSGTVYLTGTAHQLLLNEVYRQFSLTNPMHSDIFPSVRKMEAEVVAMTASLLGGGSAGDAGVCGSMTSGGTESILTAVKASRDYMAATRGIEYPEMVIAESAHAAFIKAAEYFKIRIVRVPVGHDFRLSGKAVARAITRNTILIVASAPGFPHGVVDHVADIASIARRRGVLLHVDCCLGGFVLPFARDLGYKIPEFDFSVPGVTSMSVDTHKFGQAHKGTSVVLYRSATIRRYQFTSITDWSGGLYISPGFAGSRSGALIATAWAAMVHLGREGYANATQKMMAAAESFAAGVNKIPGLEVVGSPDMVVIAFRSTRKDLNIYKVNDLLSARGWHLNALQRPAALHICFTAAHSEAVVVELLHDMKECVMGLLAHPDSTSEGEGMAPLYGMAATVPDRRVVGNFLVAYQDLLLET